MSGRIKNEKYFRNLAKRTQNTCVLCGTEFMSQRVINREHMIPRSHDPGDKRHTQNILGAHVICNTFRGTVSLVRAMRILEKSAQRDPLAFSKWANSVERGVHYTYSYPPNVTREELIGLFGLIKRLRTDDTSTSHKEH